MIWAFIELRIYYSYICCGILFIALGFFVKINNAYSGSAMVNSDTTDFLSRNHKAQADFCYYLFELVVTVDIFIEVMTHLDRSDIVKVEGSYVGAMSLLIVSGLFSMGLSQQVFDKERG